LGNLSRVAGVTEEIGLNYQITKLPNYKIGLDAGVLHKVYMAQIKVEAMSRRERSGSLLPRY
jgi:hypothetical protein